MVVVVVGQSENNGGVTFQHQLCSTKTLIHKIFSSATLDNTPTYKSHPYSVLALPNPEFDMGLKALFSVFPYNSLQVHQSVTSIPAVLFHRIYQVTIWDVKNKID